MFDTETTTDAAQRLLFGFFRLYENDRLITEGVIAADTLDYEQIMTISEYAAKCRLPIYSRERFVEDVFYPEVYVWGTLCIGFNLPFDLTRIAIHAGGGRGENRRKFRIYLSRRLRWHDMRIESASGRAAFIGFVPKRKLTSWEKPFFGGRFLDLSTLMRAFTGISHSMKSACKKNVFNTHTHKMNMQELGGINRRTLTYGRQDVRVTWALYRKLRHEYAHHPFATFENERSKPKDGRYMGQLYSSASIAKQYLRLLGITALLEKRPRLRLSHVGHAIAAYFGGRADVRVRKTDVPVRVLDFTSMYATIFCLQRLDTLLAAPSIGVQVVTAEIKALVEDFTSNNGLAMLYNPKMWLKLNCLVLVDPNWAILPVRFRQVKPGRISEANPAGSRKAKEEPYTIAVTPLGAPQARWYTLADVLASFCSEGRRPRSGERFGSSRMDDIVQKARSFATGYGFDRMSRFSNRLSKNGRSPSEGRKIILILPRLKEASKRWLRAVLMAFMLKSTFHRVILIRRYQEMLIQTYAFDPLKSTMNGPAPSPIPSSRA